MWSRRDDAGARLTEFPLANSESRWPRISKFSTARVAADANRPRRDHLSRDQWI